MGIAAELARRIIAFRYDGLPEGAVAWAKTAILDTVGVTLAGAGEECVRIVCCTAAIDNGMEPS